MPEANVINIDEGIKEKMEPVLDEIIKEEVKQLEEKAEQLLSQEKGEVKEEPQMQQLNTEDEDGGENTEEEMSILDTVYKSQEEYENEIKKNEEEVENVQREIYKAVSEKEKYLENPEIDDVKVEEYDMNIKRLKATLEPLKTIITFLKSKYISEEDLQAWIKINDSFMYDVFDPKTAALVNSLDTNIKYVSDYMRCHLNRKKSSIFLLIEKYTTPLMRSAIYKAQTLSKKIAVLKKYGKHTKILRDKEAIFKHTNDLETILRFGLTFKDFLSLPLLTNIHEIFIKEASGGQPNQIEEYIKEQMGGFSMVYLSNILARAQRDSWYVGSTFNDVEKKLDGDIKEELEQIKGLDGREFDSNRIDELFVLVISNLLFSKKDKRLLTVFSIDPLRNQYTNYMMDGMLDSLVEHLKKDDEVSKAMVQFITKPVELKFSVETNVTND